MRQKTDRPIHRAGVIHDFTLVAAVRWLDTVDRIDRGEEMRSDLIFGALAHVKNRYQLCQLASKATRKLHKPNTRLQDTTNDVFVRFHETSPVGSPAASLDKPSVQQRRAA